MLYQIEHDGHQKNGCDKDQRDGVCRAMDRITTRRRQGISDATHNEATSYAEMASLMDTANY